MGDTILISEGKCLTAPSDVILKEVSRRDFKPDEIVGNVKFIITADKGVVLTQEAAAVLRNAADDGYAAVGVYEKSDVFAPVRKVIYSLSGGGDFSDSVGAIIFPADSVLLRNKSAAYDSTRLTFLAVEEKINIKKAVIPGSGKRKLRPDFIKRYFSVFLSSKILKYVFSSVLAFVIDYALLLILNAVLPYASLEIGAFIAWCVSSFVNFNVNRRFVFSSDADIKKALAEYYSLAAAVFVLKTYVLIEFLTRALYFPLSIAKPVGEVIFFIINYIVQKLIIFKKSRK